MSDPVCGACGNRLSDHYHETHGIDQYIFCNTETNGDVFTNEPSDDTIMSFIRDRHEDFLVEIIEAWKAENN